MSEPASSSIDLAPTAKSAIRMAEKEFVLLRREIEERSRELRDVERNVVIVLVAAGPFVASSAFLNLPHLNKFGAFVAPVVALVALGRWLENLRTIRMIAIYLHEREAPLMGRQGGWETWLKTNRDKSGAPFVSSASVTFWVVIAGISTFLAVFQAMFEPCRVAFSIGIALAVANLIGWAAFAQIEWSGLRAPFD